MRCYLVITLMVLGCSPADNISHNSRSSADQDLAAAQDAAARLLDEAANALGDQTDSEPVFGWQYTNRRDEMRDSTDRTASIQSANAVNLSWPYGPVRGHIILRERAQDGFNIMFAVDQGQILCRSYSGGRVNVKFDDGPIRAFRCNEASSGSSDVVFFQSENEVLRALKAARRIIVEAEFYNSGPQQFTFNVEGLRWD